MPYLNGRLPRVCSKEDAEHAELTQRILKLEPSAAQRLPLIMKGRIRVEINGRDEFWGKAVLVEWADQYPERQLKTNGHYLLIEAGWLDDLKRIAGDCFSEIVVAPANPDRRAWLGRLLPVGKVRKAG